MANGQWPDYVNLRHPAPKRHTDERSGATHRYTRPILSCTYRQNGSPLPTAPIRAGGYSFGGRFKKEGCEGIDSSPEALLPTQAVLKSNTLRYQCCMTLRESVNVLL